MLGLFDVELFDVESLPGDSRVGTHYRGSAAEVRSLNAYIKLMRAADSVASRLDRLLAGAGLTESQFGVLEMLLHLGPLSQHEIGRKSFSSRSNVTTVVGNLERRGLIRRVRDGADHRRLIVDLTPRGGTLVRAVFPEQLKAIVGTFVTLSPRDQEELGRLCKKLGLSAAKRPPAPTRQGAE
jgi:MarR family transcriptional regulator, 2-MHQ and catechol-resistance regulon repressor